MRSRSFLRLLAIILALALILTGTAFALNSDGASKQYSGETQGGEQGLTEAQIDRILSVSDFAPGQIIVGLKETEETTREYSANAAKSEKSVAGMFPEVDVLAVKDLTDVSGIISAKSGVPIQRKTNDGMTILLLKLSADSKRDVLEAMEALKKNPYVEYAEPDFIGSACRGFPEPPEDPRLSELWGMEKIQALEAWVIETGSDPEADPQPVAVEVGVLDTGVDYNHEDLNVDYKRGYNFAYDTDDAMDDHGHGTHVAGTIGAIGDNETGVVGVCWNVSIVPLKIWDSGANGLVSDFILAMEYADIAGIPILNISGRWNPQWHVIDAPLQCMKASIDSYNGLLVAAAGNEESNIDQNKMYPASFDCENMITVAATDTNDELVNTWWSNYGEDSVHLAAPGTGILSTVPNDGYDYYEGTSMATPHVAGAAALLLSYDPNMTTQEIKSAILDNVDALPALEGLVSTGGRLNVYKAITAMDPQDSVVQVSAGNAHTLALKSDGSVWAWGDNTYGQLGDGTYINSITPVEICGLTGIVAISAGFDYSMALKRDGSVWAWGYNNDGQLGDGTLIDRNSPVQVTGLTGAVSISAGYRHSMAVKNDGTACAWGDNFRGQLGNDSVLERSEIPVQVSDLTDVVSVSAGSNHSLALKNDGTVWAWGYDEFGQLGNDLANSPFYYSNYAEQVYALEDVIEIYSADATCFALTSDGTVWAWGLVFFSPIPTCMLVPVPVSQDYPVTVTSMSPICKYTNFGQIGLLFTALMDDGSVLFFNGHYNSSDPPTQVMADIVAIEAGDGYNFAIKSDGTLWAWGDNSFGQLGDGSTTSRPTPVPIAF